MPTVPLKLLEESNQTVAGHVRHRWNWVRVGVWTEKSSVCDHSLCSLQALNLQLCKVR